jgi:DNA primase
MGEEVELIKEHLNVADVIGEYVSLKPAGANFKALCPFHAEKTPSFMVSPGRGTWYCFGACNEGGDVFSFIQKIEGVDFPAALKLLAERAGVQLTGQTRSHSQRQRLFDLMAAATRFYHEILANRSAGKRAKKYLIDRGVKAATINDFQMGYAPNVWDALQQWLGRQRYAVDEMIAAGVVGRSPRGKLYDRFRGRIIFPIADTQGRVVAFGGRVTPGRQQDDVGKYINSPEGPLYEKRRVVYNLQRAKQALRGGQPCVVVEGYMDVVLLAQAGLETVVATSGTAFTGEHVDQLRRFTNVLHFAFDADAAGWKATVAATQAALSAGMKVATVVLPAGKDPADLVVENPEGAAKIMQASRPLTSLLLEQLRASTETASQEDQLKALVLLAGRVRNPIQQGAMVQEIAQALHVPEDRIIDLLRQAQPVQPALNVEPDIDGGAAQPDLDVLAEHQLLGLLMLNRDVRKALFPYLEAGFLLDPNCQALYNSMHQIAEHKTSFFTMSGDELVGDFDVALVPLAEAIRARAEELLGTTSHTPLQEGRLLLRALQRRSLKSRLDALQQELMAAGEDSRAKALQRFQTLAHELAGIDNS